MSSRDRRLFDSGNNETSDLAIDENNNLITIKDAIQNVINTLKRNRKFENYRMELEELLGEIDKYLENIEESKNCSTIKL